MSEVSMPPDADPGLRHQDAAGWALGALDPADAEAFASHLRDCAQCQRAVAGFEAVTRALKSPAPAVEPPPGLEAKTIASVQNAVLAARQAQQAATAQHNTMVTAAPAQQGPAVASVAHAGTTAEGTGKGAEPEPAKMAKWWHWHWNLPSVSAASALAGAAVAIAAVLLVPLFQAAPAVAATFYLDPPPGGAASAVAGAASGVAKVQPVAGGYLIHLTVHGLKSLGPGSVYECGYSQSGTSSQWITAGSFSSSGSHVMMSAANPHMFTVMKIYLERAGDFNPADGTLVLSGKALTAGLR
jgi:hypothetical protein